MNVHLSLASSPLCPVAAMLAYMASRRDTPGPFFRDERGQPLPKATFVRKNRQALSQLCLPAKQFAGHSFHIGAATAAAQVGLEDFVIQALGHWFSTAFCCTFVHPRTPGAVYWSFGQPTISLPVIIIGSSHEVDRSNLASLNASGHL